MDFPPSIPWSAEAALASAAEVDGGLGGLRLPVVEASRPRAVLHLDATPGAVSEPVVRPGRPDVKDDVLAGEIPVTVAAPVASSAPAEMATGDGAGGSPARAPVESESSRCDGQSEIAEGQSAIAEGQSGIAKSQLPIAEGQSPRAPRKHHLEAGAARVAVVVRAREMEAAGRTLDEMSAALGVSRSSLQRWLRRTDGQAV